MSVTTAYSTYVQVKILWCNYEGVCDFVHTYFDIRTYFCTCRCYPTYFTCCFSILCPLCSIHTCIHLYPIHVYVHTHTHMRAHTYTHTHAHTHTHTRTHTHTLVHTHARAHTHTHTHTHSYTCRVSMCIMTKSRPATTTSTSMPQCGWSTTRDKCWHTL